MLRPILEAPFAADAPERVRDVFTRTHFSDQAAARGVRSVPAWTLLWLVREALEAGHSDLVEPVFDICPVSRLYRIILPEGAFYPVVRAGVPVTLYTADMVRALRGTRRWSKRTTGRRIRPHASA